MLSTYLRLMKRYLYAFIAGIAIVLYHFSVFAAIGDLSKLDPVQWQRLEYLGFARYLFLILGVVLSIRLHRRTHSDNATLKSLFLVGLAASTIIAHFVGIMEYAWTSAHPEFFEVYMNSQVLQAQQSGMDPEKIQQLRTGAEQMKFLQTPLMSGIFYFVETMIIGALSSLVSAFLWKNTAEDSRASVSLSQQE